MARKKQYVEAEVVEKALHVFWRNGYEATSTRMLEREMGINQFSIYSSFKNKEGLLLETVKCYKKKLKSEALNTLMESSDGLHAIKEYFYAFLKFSKENNYHKGCFLTNTSIELGDELNEQLRSEIDQFANTVQSTFLKVLENDNDSYNNTQAIRNRANYLFITLLGLSTSSRMMSENELIDFIEMTFERI